MFLRKHLQHVLDEIVTVDISEDVVSVGTEHFGFHPDEKLHSIIADAYDFIQNQQDG